MHNDHHRTPSHLSLEFKICNNQHRFKVTIINKALYFNIALWMVINTSSLFFMFNINMHINALYYDTHTHTLILHILGIQYDMYNDVWCYNVDASTTIGLRPFHIVLHESIHYSRAGIDRNYGGTNSRYHNIVLFQGNPPQSLQTLKIKSIFWD